MSDSSRKFLLTKFRCMACGSALQLSYDDPPRFMNVSSGEPTGADMVATTIGVHPCSNCQRKRDEIDNAIKTILALGTTP